MCMRVVLCQRKKGLPSFFALSMKLFELSTSTSSKVSMSYLALRLSCQFCRFFMFGDGAQVVQVAEEFVEAVYAWQVLIQVAEMVLAELAGGVAYGFEGTGEGGG